MTKCQLWLTTCACQPKLPAMAEHGALADQATNSDPEMGLRSVRALRDLADRLEALQVANARRSGWSWREIADVLGITRQAVHKKHRDIR